MATAICLFSGDQDDAGLPLLQELLAQYPQHAAANYTLGRTLLAQADQASIDYIETAIAQRRDWVIEGCELIHHFLQQQQPESAQRYRQRAEQHYQIPQAAQAERASVSDRDLLKCMLIYRRETIVRSRSQSQDIDPK